MTSVINTLPNFKPINFMGKFLSLKEAKIKIHELNNFIKWYIRLDVEIYMDDNDLYNDTAIEELEQKAAITKWKINYLKEQIRCWNLEKIN